MVVRRYPNRRQIERFIDCVRDFYAKNKRILPWRWEKDPYKIFVSEVMLQQTQVTRVLKKYAEFLEQFPDFRTLAEASLPHVLKVWQGLGYNRRGINLKKAAEAVQLQYNGVLPKDIASLDALPGIGAATASSIAAFAWNIPSVFLETNVRSALIKHFFNKEKGNHGQKEGNIGNIGKTAKVSDKELANVFYRTFENKWVKNNAREWYYALMDYGSFLKKTENHALLALSYKKQSRFTGSIRQMRGAILRVLTNSVSHVTISRETPSKSSKISIQQLKSMVLEDTGDNSKFEALEKKSFDSLFHVALYGLYKDGFLAINGKKHTENEKLEPAPYQKSTQLSPRTTIALVNE